MRTIRRSLLLLAAVTFIFGAVLTAPVALGSVGSSTSQQGNLAQTAPSKPTVQICSATEQCTPAAPLNSPAPVPQILSLGFVAASVAILADRRRRRRSPRDTLAPFGIPSAIFRPPIASGWRSCTLFGLSPWTVTPTDDRAVVQPTRSTCPNWRVPIGRSPSCLLSSNPVHPLFTAA